MTKKLNSNVLSKNHCEAKGWPVEITQKWIPFYSKKGAPGRAGVRKDLFGFIDLIALLVNGPLLIQACGADVKSHVEKLNQPEVKEAVKRLEFDKLELWSWRKKKYRGVKKPVMMLYRHLIIYDNEKDEVVLRYPPIVEVGRKCPTKK